jgi:hypothetical protein
MSTDVAPLTSGAIDALADDLASTGYWGPECAAADTEALPWESAEEIRVREFDIGRRRTARPSRFGFVEISRRTSTYLAGERRRERS